MLVRLLVSKLACMLLSAINPDKKMEYSVLRWKSEEKDILETLFDFLKKRKKEK